MIRFTINGQGFESPRGRVSVEWLLKQVGLGPGDTELVREATGEKWTDPAAHVELHDGDRFEVERRGDKPPPEARIRYTVNGEAQVTTRTPLTVEEILRRAGTDAAVDLDQLDSYYLDNVRTAQRYENLGDEVPIIDGDQFVALYGGPAPVA